MNNTTPRAAETAQTFTSQSDSCGYMIFCDGSPIGGARTNGSSKHTSDGRRRSWQARRSDMQMHADTARRICEELANGHGPAYLRAAIAKATA